MIFLMPSVIEAEEFGLMMRYLFLSPPRIADAADTDAICTTLKIIGVSNFSSQKGRGIKYQACEEQAGNK
jgi:hypothetical protein